MTTDHTHVVSNGKRELTIDELARQQPGMDRLMAEVEPEMSAYLRNDFDPVTQAIKAQDGPAFDAAYAVMVDRANALHGVFGKPYLGWRTPSTPPDDLDLTAGMDA